MFHHLPRKNSKKQSKSVSFVKRKTNILFATTAPEVACKGLWSMRQYLTKGFCHRDICFIVAPLLVNEITKLDVSNDSTN